MSLVIFLPGLAGVKAGGVVVVDRHGLVGAEKQ